MSDQENDRCDEEGCEMRCQQCEHPNMDFQATITEHIRLNGGCAVIPVFDSGFVYTVGLKESFGCAEFIIAGSFGVDQMCEIITEALNVLKKNHAAFDGEEIPGIIKLIDPVSGDLVDGILGCRTIVKSARTELMCKAAQRYGDDGFEGKQLVFPDQAGRLPWHPGFDKMWGRSQRTLYALDENGK